MQKSRNSQRERVAQLRESHLLDLESGACGPASRPVRLSLVALESNEDGDASSDLMLNLVPCGKHFIITSATCAITSMYLGRAMGIGSQAFLWSTVGPEGPDRETNKYRTAMPRTALERQLEATQEVVAAEK